MANILDEIVKKLNPGGVSYYADRNNTLDSKTITEVSNEFDKFITNEKNWGELINAIYSTHADFKSGKYAVAPSKKKGEFTVINTKNPKDPSFDVKVTISKNTLIINNLKSASNDTKIELGTMLETAQSTETPKEFAQSIIDNLESKAGSFKSPKEVVKYLEALISKYK